MAYTPKVDEIGPVPVLDETVRVRAIGVRERNDYVQPLLEAVQEGRSPDPRALLDRLVTLVHRAVVDENGERLWTLEEVEALPPDAVDFIANKIERLNGLTAEGRDEIAGNSTATEDD